MSQEQVIMYYYRRCFVCDQLVPDNMIRRRDMLTGVTLSHRWDQWFGAYRSDHYQLVTLCPACDDAEERRLQQQRQRTRLLYAYGAGVLLLMVYDEMNLFLILGVVGAVALTGLLTRVVIASWVIVGGLWFWDVRGSPEHVLALMVALTAAFGLGHIVVQQRKRLLAPPHTPAPPRLLTDDRETRGPAWWRTWQGGR